MQEQTALLDEVRHDALQGLPPAWAARWPALADVPWFPAIGDGACSNVGSGCTSPERIALMVGTSGAMRVVVDAPDAPVVPGLWCYRVDRRRPLLGGALSEGGNLFAWMRSTLHVDALPALEDEIAAMAPDGHGLSVLPFLAGERSPGWAAAARGAIVGLTLATQPAHILRAGLEAVAYRFALIHQRLDAVAAPDAVAVASGGALLGSPVWMDIMADVLGRTVVASGEREASSRGAALLALEALGLLPDIAAVPTKLGPVHQPDAARHARYQEAIARQVHLYDLLVGTPRTV
jgi:gluconokinase